jgi:hypothetical protein
MTPDELFDAWIETQNYPKSWDEVVIARAAFLAGLQAGKEECAAGEQVVGVAIKGLKLPKACLGGEGQRDCFMYSSCSLKLNAQYEGRTSGEQYTRRMRGCPLVLCTINTPEVKK